MIETLRIFMIKMFKAVHQSNHRKMYDRLRDENIQILELDFDNNPICMKVFSWKC